MISQESIEWILATDAESDDFKDHMIHKKHGDEKDIKILGILRNIGVS